MMAAIDTHAAVKGLILTGFSELQAEEIAKLLLSGQNVDHLVTQEQFSVFKERLADVESDIHEMKNDIQEIKSDIKDIRADMKAMESGIRSDMKVLESNMRADMSDMKNDILKWMLPLLITILGLMISSIFMK